MEDMSEEPDQAPSGSATDDAESKDRLWMRTYNFSEQQVTELKETFAMFDSSGRGTVAGNNIGTALRTMAQNPTEADIREMLADANLDDDGNMSLDEFMRVIGTRGLRSDPEMEEELEEALRVFDKSGEGCIEAGELKRLLSTMGEPIDDDDLAELLKVAEVAGDGKINYYDFMKKLTSK